jgi:hypothetical protein
MSGFYGAHEEFAGWTVDQIVEALDAEVTKGGPDKAYGIKLMQELESRV